MNTVANALTVDHEPLDVKPVPRPVAETHAPMSPSDLVSYAIQSGQSLEVIREAVALSRELKREQALEAFDAAVADAKAEIGPAVKNRTGNNSKRYADFAAYAAVVDPIIGKHGLSYRFRTTQDERIHVTCVLSHRSGHREETTLSGPADATGSKNAIQAIGSTLTYLQRYTLVQALGLAASEDDDGAAHGKTADDIATISDDQEMQLREMIEATNSNLSQFLAIGRLERLSDMKAADFGGAMNILKQRMSQRGER